MALAYAGYLALLVTSDLRRVPPLGFRADFAGGAVVVRAVTPGSIAARADLRPDDRIVRANAQVATLLSQMFNQGLDGVVADSLRDLPGIRIDRLDAYRLLTDLVASPSVFGLTNVTGACLTPYVPLFTCGSPDEFLFWDGIHPTRAVHAIIAQEAATVLLQ